MERSRPFRRGPAKSHGCPVRNQRRPQEPLRHEAFRWHLPTLDTERKTALSSFFRHGRACPGHPRRAASHCDTRVRRRYSLRFPTVSAAVDREAFGYLGGIVGSPRRGWPGLRPAM